MFIKDPLANLMASFNLTIALEEGTNFIFSSWAFVADGAGSFHRHLATTTGPKAPALTPYPTIDDLVDDRGKIQLSNLIRSRAATDLN
jgi:hypothetical protein